MLVEVCATWAQISTEAGFLMSIHHPTAEELFKFLKVIHCWMLYFAQAAIIDLLIYIYITTADQLLLQSDEIQGHDQAVNFGFGLLSHSCCDFTCTHQ